MSNIDKQARQVSRYDLVSGYMQKWPDGDFVYHSDYQALLDELEAKDRRIEEEIGRANREHHRGFMMACGHLKEHSNVHYADAAEMEIAALRNRINELESTPPAPVSVPDELSREEYKRRFMEEDNFDDTFRGGWNACRAAMLQGAEPVTTAYKFPEGWVMVPKEPTEVMFNAGKLAAGPTKQPDTASLVYKAMIDSSPDYKVGREAAFTGYEVQENVKDYVRRKIHTAFDVEKAVLWILKNSKYPEPDLWVFDIKVQSVDGPLILTDKSVTIVHSTLCKCSPPVGNVQFINCTLPAEWEGKVNAIDCVFKADLQQEVKP